MRSNTGEELAGRIALGAAAGLAGTIVLQAMMAARGKLEPATLPPIRQDPGEFILQRAESLLPRRARRRIPGAAETAGAKVLAVGYGMTFGALYGGLRGKAPNQWVPSLVEGVALGLVSWAVGYLGWLPAAGLVPPVWRQKEAQVIGPTIDHAVYGAVTAAVYKGLCRIV